MSDEEGKPYKAKHNINEVCQIQSKQGSWRKKRIIGAKHFLNNLHILFLLITRLVASKQNVQANISYTFSFALYI